MRILIFGNSGSGKSHCAKRLSADHGLAHLDLDTIAWEPGQIAVPRPLAAAQQDLNGFVLQHENWVIEGCYGELTEFLSPRCSELVFMNPGQEVCLMNNHRRPFEPHKYASEEAQERMLPQLLEWVADYYSRAGTWSYEHHRQLFDAHSGAKREITGRGEL